MSQTIQAIYENGLLRPLVSLDLPEKTVVELDLRLQKSETENLRQKVRGIFQEAGLSKPINFGLPKSKITEERRRELAERFSAEKSLGEYIDEDREERG